MAANYVVRLRSISFVTVISYCLSPELPLQEKQPPTFQTVNNNEGLRNTFPWKEQRKPSKVKNNLRYRGASSWNKLTGWSSDRVPLYWCWLALIITRAGDLRYFQWHQLSAKWPQVIFIPMEVYNVFMEGEVWRCKVKWLQRLTPGFRPSILDELFLRLFLNRSKSSFTFPCERMMICPTA